MEKAEMIRRLAQELPEKRYHHVVAVSETAVQLARHYGVDEHKAEIAGLLHDCARKIPTKKYVEKAAELGIAIDAIEKAQPILIHAKLGAYLAKTEFGVTDPEILESIRYHTTGAAHMTPLDQVIYLADLVEPHRDFAGVEQLRKDVLISLPYGMEQALIHTMHYLLGQGSLIHPDCLSGYNELVLRQKNS